MSMNDYTTRNYARMLLLIVVEYLFSPKIETDKFSIAIMSLCCIGMNSYKGIVAPFGQLIEVFEQMKDLGSKSTEDDIEKVIDDKPEIKKFLDSIDELDDYLDEKTAPLLRDGWNNLSKRILNGEFGDDILFECLLYIVIGLHSTFAADHLYYGEDNGVYFSILSSLKDFCVSVLGLKPEDGFKVFQNLNDRTIDEIGYTERI